MAKATEKAEARAVRILVVDEHPAVREMLLYAFRRRGWQAEGAEDGLEALARLQHQRFDAVVTDLQMPRLDGLSLLREVRRMCHPLPVVVQTSALDASLTAQLEWAGAFRVLLKGGRLTDLMRSMEEACQVSESPPARCA